MPMRDEMDAYPAAWETLPKDCIHHCHVKNAVKNDPDKVWLPTGTGVIDWAGQFRGLGSAEPGESHWHRAASLEESSRVGRHEEGARGRRCYRT